MENLDKWRKAGGIAATALEYGAGLIKKGASFLEVSQKVDDKIISLGAFPAFPTQISRDHIAAHDCAEPDDESVFENEVCCLDVGAHIDGCIADNATTIDLSGVHGELVKASREALSSAVKILAPGVKTGEIGRVIQETITSYGFSPVKNLSGHGISVYKYHDLPSIPNYADGSAVELKKGMVIAIEPFATAGKGFVYELERAGVFVLEQKKPVRDLIARNVLAEIEKSYPRLPFATRWLAKKFPLGKVRYALRLLAQAGIVREYPPLVEQNKGLVSQAEKTILIDDKVEVLTRV